MVDEYTIISLASGEYISKKKITAYRKKLSLKGKIYILK